MMAPNSKSVSCIIYPSTTALERNMLASTYWTFISDPDNVMRYAEMHFQTMSVTDVFARSSASWQEVRNKYRASLASSMTPQESGAIGRAIHVAQAKLNGYPRLAEQVPWKVAILRGEPIPEGGWPHTVGDIIIIPSTLCQPGVHNLDDLARIMIHEKIHVYQRMFPAETHILYTRIWGLRVVQTAACSPPLSSSPSPPSSSSLSYHATSCQRRANPDISNISYAMGDGVVCNQEYRSATPKGLSDSRVICRDAILGHSVQSKHRLAQFEHPNEAMAYILTDFLYDGIDQAQPEHAWMRIYL